MHMIHRIFYKPGQIRLTQTKRDLVDPAVDDPNLVSALIGIATIASYILHSYMHGNRQIELIIQHTAVSYSLEMSL